MNGVRTEVVAARGTRPEPAAVHFHRGSYCVGSPRMARTWAWLEACAIAYAHRADWADPSVSPMLAAPGGLPPMLLQTGSNGLLAPDAERLAAMASVAGVAVTYTRWPRMWHDFTLLPGLLAAADSAVSQAAWFVETVTGA